MSGENGELRHARLRVVQWKATADVDVFFVGGDCDRDSGFTTVSTSWWAQSCLLTIS